MRIDALGPDFLMPGRSFGPGLVSVPAEVSARAGGEPYFDSEFDKASEPYDFLT